MLAEDDLVDAMIVKHAFRDTQITNQLVHRINGRQTLEYLRKADNEKPCLILLDLSMPKMDGLEFLRIAKADEALKNIPVIVLTTSSEEQEVTESFKLGAAGYMVKSVAYKEFVETIRAINLYWTFSELPNED